VLTGRDVVQVSRLVGDLVLRPGVSMVSGVVGLNPRVGVSDGVSGLRARELSTLSSGEESRSSSGSVAGGSIGTAQARGIIVVQTKSLESISHVLISISSVNSGSHSRSDGLHGIVRVLVLTSGNIIKIGRLVRDLILRPGIGMFSWEIRLNPRVAICDGISSLGSWEFL